MNTYERQISVVIIPTTTSLQTDTIDTWLCNKFSSYNQIQMHNIIPGWSSLWAYSSAAHSLAIISLWSRRFTWYSTEFIITIYPVIIVRWLVPRWKRTNTKFHSSAASSKNRMRPNPHSLAYMIIMPNNSKSRLSLLNKWNHGKIIGLRSSSFQATCTLSLFYYLKTYGCKWKTRYKCAATHKLPYSLALRFSYTQILCLWKMKLFKLCLDMKTNAQQQIRIGEENMVFINL